MTETRTSPHLIKIIYLGLCKYYVESKPQSWKVPVWWGCCTQILVNFYPLYTQYSLGIFTSVSFQNCSPQQLIWSLIYSVGKIQRWWPSWWEIILILTLLSCVQDSNMKLPAHFPCLVPFSLCQFPLNLLSGKCFLPWQSCTFSYSCNWSLP